jgi:competence protein ComEC
LVSIANAISAAHQDRRGFVLLPFAMILGMMIYAQLPFEPDRLALAAVACAVSGLVLLLWRSPLLSVGFVALAFWAGICLLPIHGAAFGTQMLARPAYGTFKAQVVEVLAATADAQRIVVQDFHALDGDSTQPIRMARIVAPAEPKLQAGDIIGGKMRLAPVPGPILPGAYDGQFHSYFSGIGA